MSTQNPVMNSTVLKSTVLVVDDEPDLADALVARLQGEGFETLQAFDGPTAVERCLNDSPDLMILDLNLPGFDGLEVCRQVHAVKRVPIVMLTARDEETDMLIGLGLGADDYLTKPFSMRELVARVRVVLRRSQLDAAGAVDRPLEAGGLKIDIHRRTVLHNSLAVHLTATEFDLLRTLTEAKGAVLTREQLLFRVWGYRDGSGSRTVDSHVRSVRRKTSDDVIRTVHGVGYSLGNDGSCTDGLAGKVDP